MNRINAKFKELEKRKQKALIGYVCAGDPDFETSLQIAETLVKSGVDILELGLPFSDPIADGPVIQKAGQRALKAGMNTDVFFRLAGKIRSKHKTPLACMTYYNLVLHRGLGRFTLDCRKVDIDALIIPELPVEESAPLLKACRKNDINLIMFVAPTTTEERMKRILKQANGFVYVVSVRGITGVRKKLSNEVEPLIRRIRRINKNIPLAVGFGISNPEQVKSAIKAGADAAIVGSAFIKIIEENLKDKRLMISKLMEFTSEMKKSTLS